MNRSVRLSPACRPLPGFALPCRFVSAQGGDTVVVALGGGLEYAIRLIGVDSAAKRYTEDTLSEADELLLWVPIPNELAHVNPLAALSPDCIPAHIYVDSENTLSELLIRSGHGTETG